MAVNLFEELNNMSKEELNKLKQILGIKEDDNLRMIIPECAKEMGDKVNNHLNIIRKNKEQKNYVVPIEHTRFSNGESKIKILDTVKDKDLYIITDVCNYSIPFKMHGYTSFVSPVMHFADEKSIISAAGGAPDKTTVIELIKYAGRQHKRNGRESRDCVDSLRELENIGVKSFVTFDIHDKSVSSALTANVTFDNYFPTNEIVKSIITLEDIDYDKIDLIAPDNGAFDRAKYYAQMFGSENVSSYYKIRNFLEVVNGKNPIIAHKFNGKSVKGRVTMVVDDLISSGESILETAVDLRKRGASDIYLISTFGLFTDGISMFDKAYERGTFNKLYTTNLTYIPNDVKSRPWIEIVDMSYFIATIIDTMNKRESVSFLMNGKQEVVKLIKQKKKL